MNLPEFTIADRKRVIRADSEAMQFFVYKSSNEYADERSWLKQLFVNIRTVTNSRRHVRPRQIKMEANGTRDLYIVSIYNWFFLCKISRLHITTQRCPK